MQKGNVLNQKQCKYLRDFIVRNGYTSTGFSRHIGRSRAWISGILHGITVSPNAIKRLCSYLDIDYPAFIALGNDGGGMGRKPRNRKSRN